MDRQRRERVAEIMAAITGGDDAAAITLAMEFRQELAGAVRAAALRLGVGLEADELNGLVLEAALAIGEVAGGWRDDGGALPWNWGRARIRNVVAHHVGVFAERLEPDHLDNRPSRPAVEAWQGDAADDRQPHRVLERLADHHVDVARVRDVAARVGEVDLDLLLEFRMQQSQGDPSPAVTIARARGLRPETVRKRVSRYCHRARQVIAADPALADLASVPLFAGVRPSPAGPSNPPTPPGTTLAPVA